MSTRELHADSTIDNIAGVRVARSWIDQGRFFIIEVGLGRCTVRPRVYFCGHACFQVAGSIFVSNCLASGLFAVMQRVEPGQIHLDDPLKRPLFPRPCRYPTRFPQATY